VAACCAAIALPVVRLVRGGLDSDRRRILARGYTMLYCCKGCGATGEVRLYDETWPIVCPRCGRRQAVAGFRCTNPRCRKIIPIRNALFQCPHCGRSYDHRSGPDR